MIFPTAYRIIDGNRGDTKMNYNSEKTWNGGHKYNQAIPTVFKEISTPENLIRYLEDTPRRTKDYRYVYHYTTLRNLIKILQGKCWHLSNAKDMNDQLEYKHGDKSRWERIFFSSFMMDSKESIGMWSMYAQPWESGVKIAIPTSELRKWIATSPKIFGLKKNHAGSFDESSRSLEIDNINTVLTLSSVAYSNADSLEIGESEQLTWGKAGNTLIKNAPNIPELTGYIKDKAWDYEKEIRLKITFASSQDIDRVAVELSDDLINSMIITASPLFDGSLQERIQTEIERQIKTEKSIFANRLFIRTICSNCEDRKRRTSA